MVSVFFTSEKKPEHIIEHALHPMKTWTVLNLLVLTEPEEKTDISKVYPSVVSFTEVKVGQFVNKRKKE
ncbi:hypothetical protein Pfo_015008 [Paulownia fortunei]|nr:hypothetical protein Pfo_015008 [Paulownia fortunei]